MTISKTPSMPTGRFTATLEVILFIATAKKSLLATSNPRRRTSGPRNVLRQDADAVEESAEKGKEGEIGGVVFDVAGDEESALKGGAHDYVARAYHATLVGQLHHQHLESALRFMEILRRDLGYHRT